MSKIKKRISILIIVTALLSLLLHSTNINAEENENYPQVKFQVTEFLNYYKKEFTDEILNNKKIEEEIKKEIIYGYNLLKEEDQEPYKEFIYRILRGGVPEIIQEKRSLTYKINENIDLYSLIKAIDNEDGIIIPDKNNTEIKTNLNTSLAGIYQVLYILKDKDGNKVEYKITINILNNIPKQKEIVTNNNYNQEESIKVPVPNTGI